ncbi:MAG: bifunctional demethylmenaquinone methyltransferase/2-methoxy-6-polyprenyl-1,4-benzoquinol methylase UbiE [Bacteroidales bacterium]|nr:bifunctional demethylmenaquinone methyltransferase/2-methoxy-6-polyprenyl-1,4-benzoquinol methylase UbiE [Bacteroidales bacterium]
MPKKEKIQEMFDVIAPDYDRLNHIMSLGIDKTWRNRAIKHIPGGKVLDIACGTGDFSIAIAKKTTATVTGFDLSAGMLKIMDEKVKAEGLDGRIETLQGDCEKMPFQDNSFDCVTIGFGIRNFEHREEALKEILRVLRPGGKLIILELSIPENPVIRWFYKLYFSGITPTIGGMISGQKAAYKYLPASVIAFPPKAKWMKTMSDCGYSEVRHKAFTLGICRMYIGKKL